MRMYIMGVLVFFMIASCNSVDKSPGFITYKIMPDSAESAYGSGPFINEQYAFPEKGFSPVLDSMLHLQYTYFSERDKFDIFRFRDFWEQFRPETVNRELSKEELIEWIDLTGFLFQLTAGPEVAEELERTAFRHLYKLPGIKADSLIMPYIFTRNTDRVHVNLFLPAEISFEHSLGGQVIISQKTGFPGSGKILLVFGMETKQYVELNIRIPSWAENASVTVKGVKYVATPGSYCLVAKKWKQGDEAVIEIPLNNLPGYFTPGN